MPKRRSKPSAVPPVSPDPASRVDQDLVASAYRKLVQKTELSKSERLALKRHEKDKEQRLRRQFYGSIPQKHWKEMSGRQTKVINEQASRYGIPFGGAVIHLPSVVKALHDFLAENAQLLAREADDLLQGNRNEPASPALERYREERAILAKLDRLEREGKLLARDEVRLSLGRIASILRGAGETLSRQHGGPAAEILHEALDEAEREISRAFGQQPAEGRSDGSIEPSR